MLIQRHLARILLSLGVLVGHTHAIAERHVHLAVASNFAATADKLKTRFEADSPYELSFSLGSSGKLYAQIVNGAPFHVFLSADQEKPQALMERELASDRFTYALGKLVVWIREPNEESWQNQLGSDKLQRLALANPRLAPYGAAARDTLVSLGLVEKTQPRWVMGENIGQTFQFLSSGNAGAGFIAYSQLEFVRQDGGLTEVVPAKYHQPIAQDAVLLPRGSAHPGAKAFFKFLRTDVARAIIQKDGYGLSENRSSTDDPVTKAAF